MTPGTILTGVGDTTDGGTATFIIALTIVVTATTMATTGILGTTIIPANITDGAGVDIMNIVTGDITTLTGVTITTTPHPLHTANVIAIMEGEKTPITQGLRLHIIHNNNNKAHNPAVLTADVLPTICSRFPATTAIRKSAPTSKLEAKTRVATPNPELHIAEQQPPEPLPIIAMWYRPRLLTGITQEAV